MTGGAGAVADGSAGDRPYVPALDGLRGVAVLLVMVFHFAEAIRPVTSFDAIVRDLLRVGWIGVDLFFVLSGFLITRNLLADLHRPNYYRRFFWRRVLRIAPVYVAALLIVGSLGRLVLVPRGHLSASAVDGEWWCWLYLTNIVIAARDSWLAVPVYFVHFWSLAIEEQFYLVWPGIVRRLSAPSLARLAAGLILLAITIRVVWIAANRDTLPLYVFTLTRLDGIAIGAILAAASVDTGVRHVLERRGSAAAVASALMIAAVFVVRGGLFELDPWVAALVYPATALMFGGVVWRAVGGMAHGPTRRALESRGMRAVGRYSYAAYVIHYPLRIAAVRALRRLLDARVGGSALPSGLSFVAIAVVSTMAIAWISWRVLERPSLRFRSAGFAA